jgi:hypothetical protein
MLGFCRTLVSESDSNKFAVAWPMVTAKLVAFRWARLLSVRLVPVVPVVVVPVVVVLVVVVLVVVVVALVTCNWTAAVPGSWMPMVLVLSRLTSSKATSTTTSGRDLSKSLISFCAKSSSSGVARITIALWLGTP